MGSSSRGQPGHGWQVGVRWEERFILYLCTLSYLDGRKHSEVTLTPNATGRLLWYVYCFCIICANNSHLATQFCFFHSLTCTYKHANSLSQGMDISFIGSQHVYGIPEHSTRLALPPTLEGGVPTGDPYRYLSPPHCALSLYSLFTISS